MLEVNATPDVSPALATVAAGEHATGEFHCAGCGYGVTVLRELPRCPMCSGEAWEQKPWSPFARARSRAQ